MRKRECLLFILGADQHEQISGMNWEDDLSHLQPAQLPLARMVLVLHELYTGTPHRTHLQGESIHQVNYGYLCARLTKESNRKQRTPLCTKPPTGPRSCFCV